MEFIKNYWWKFLGVFLILFVIVVGLKTPLKGSIKRVEPYQIASGLNNQIIIKGYNTNFQKNDLIEAWFINESNKGYKADVQVIDKHTLKASIFSNNELVGQDVNLIINSKNNFYSIQDACVFIETNDIDSNSLMNYSATEKNINHNRGFPNRELLSETIRNLFFHVPMWFVMMLIMLIACFHSIKYLMGFNIKYDAMASNAVNVGLLFTTLGLLTGSLWAKFTWSEHTEIFSLEGWWANDVKLNGAAITALIYLAYNVLRGSINEENQRAKIAAVYNIFAFVMLLVFLMILPRLTDSLHPGNGGNPAFSQYDLDSSLRFVFYPAVIGWFLIALWILNIKNRLSKIQDK